MSYNAKVYRTQGATAMVVASGGQIQIEAGGGITGLGAAGALPGKLASGSFDLTAHLFMGRNLASAETLATGVAPFLTASADAPQVALTSSGDQSMYLNYASAVVAGVKVLPFSLPQDLSTAAGLTIELKGETAGTASAADAAQGFDIRVWSGVGDTEMGATHPNFTTTPTWKGITVASGDLTTGMINVTLVPSAHANRAIRLYGMRARYTRTS